MDLEIKQSTERQYLVRARIKVETPPRNLVPARVLLIGTHPVHLVGIVSPSVISQYRVLRVIVNGIVNGQLLVTAY